jgi:O-antigen ligase
MKDLGLRNIRLFLAFTYTCFLAGFFFLPNAVDLFKFYVAAVFIPGILTIARPARLASKNKVWIATITYLGYMLSTSFWSSPFAIGTFWDDAQLAAYIAAFPLISISVDQVKQHYLDSILKLICIGAGIAAIASIPYWYQQHPFPNSRLIGIGIIENPNPSSFVYGTFAILSYYYAWQSSNFASRLVFIVCTATLLVFVILTQSSTGIIATHLSLLLLTVLLPRNKQVAAGILIILGTLIMSYLLASPLRLSQLTTISFLERTHIWKHALDLILTSPLIGQGYQTEFLVRTPNSTAVYTSAHNTFIATLRDGGLIGLGLQLLLLATAVKTSLAEHIDRKNPLYLVLLVFGSICMLTATDRLITRPRELWVIFWLPLAMLIARQASESQHLETVDIKQTSSVK